MVALGVESLRGLNQMLRAGLGAQEASFAEFWIDFDSSNAHNPSRTSSGASRVRLKDKANQTIVKMILAGVS
jgi:hypothetical protein